MSSQIEEIKSKIDIVDLVGSYLRLQKAGANFKALCPFHGEKTPSFNVSPVRQIWHCFGCGIGGDIFEFIQKIEGVEFVDALKTLADRAGVELKREDPQFRTERNRQLALLEEAAKFFEDNLVANQQISEKFVDSRQENNVTPFNYLHQRGLTDETIREFRLGYAPDEWRALSGHLKTRGFSSGEIEKSGLVAKNQRDFYDRFRGRIMFPIFDYNGRVIAFGGRIYPEKENEAKYVNSPETAFYQKSRILYGLNKSKQEILRTGECVLVEGYMDMVMSWQSGVKNVAASSGTALTLEQLKLLSRLCGKIILAFDIDVAGDAANKRGINLLKNILEQNLEFDVKVVKLYKFKDAADAVKEDPAVWRAAVTASVSIAKFYIDTALKKYGSGTPEAKIAFQRNVLPLVASLAELERAHWVREISNILNIREDSVWDALKRIDVKIPVQSKPAEIVKNKTRKDLLEEKVLGIVAEYPALAPKLDPSFAALVSAGSKTGIFAEMFLNGAAEAEAELIKCQKELKKEYLKERLTLLSRDISAKERAGGEDLKTLLDEFYKISKEFAKI